MTGRIKTKGRLRAVGLAAAIAVLAPLSASQAETTVDDADVSAADVAATEIVQPTFASQFESIPEPSTKIEAPANAVDLDTFDPPLEESASADGQTVRSLGTGMASYYGRRFHGKRTANGERFNMRAMTAAHKSLPFGTRVRVTNARNGRSVIVRINDRGPFVRGRTIDLSRAAAEQIGMVSSGHARVKLEVVR